MTNSKATKKALFTSMISLLLCFTMLMGATFAWFTDTVKSTGNRIVAGNLDVDLIMDKPDADGNYDGKYISIAEPETEAGRGDIFSEAAGNGTNWEPGKTEIVYLGVKNNGSLALKYNIILNIADEGLIGSLEYAILDGVTSETKYTNWTGVKDAANGQTGDLPKGQVVAAQGGVLDEIIKAENPRNIADEDREVDYFALAIHMKEEAGNEYQNKGVKIDVQVLATQKDAEEDSFDNTYDAEAEFKEASADDYQSAINEGGNVRLISDIVLTDGETLTIPEGKSVVIDLNGNSIIGSNAKDADAVITNAGTLTIVGGTVSSTATNGAAAISNSGTLTLKGVTVNGAPLGETEYPAYAVYTSGKLTVEEGTTIAAERGAISMTDGSDVIINGGNITVSDAADGRTLTLHTIYAEGRNSKLTINGGSFENNYSGVSGASVICPAGATITINGGTFRDAVDSTEDFNNTANFQNYMGYGSVVTVRGGTYDDSTVLKNVASGYAATQNSDGTYTVAAKVPTTSAELEEVIEAGVSEITLAAGTYTMPSSGSTGTIAITGTKDSVVDVTTGAYLDSAKVSFEGVTIKTSTGYVYDANGNKGSDYAALYTPNVTYTDCTFVGPMRVGRDGAKFVNCTFTELGNDYVWTYGNDVTFENCTFETAGKAILVYSDGGDEVSQVSVTGCTFKATVGGTAWQITNQNCAAIEIHNYGNGVNLTTSNNTVNTDHFSGEWRIKEYVSGNPGITVNGVEYTQTALDGKLMTVTNGVATFD